jgi:hypothetical protein
MEENAYTTLVGKPEKKRRLASRRSRWEAHTKTNLIKIELESLNWTHLTQNMH